MKKHVNIPVFIPHLGCPNQCVFCNQRAISGVREFNPDDLEKIIDEALATVDTDTEVEVAFFGGSFTGIDRNLMVSLLKIANSYIRSGRIFGIRCSTRPDYINEEILEILAFYGVKVIELGLQSINENVLKITKRGHSFEAERRACDLIIKSGFTLVGQMMIGLPGSDIKSELETAEFIINSGAKGARIYPTVVFRGTELACMAMSGDYEPLALDDAVKRSARVMQRFLDAGVSVIRVGLCSSENLADDKSYFAGPNHPALGELVENELFYNVIREELGKTELKNKIPTVFVPRGSLSKAIGQRKINKKRLTFEFSLSDIKFAESDKLSAYTVSVVI
jgi:histone acetyltransferase (RNA polymerase elongator complex component)